MDSLRAVEVHPSSELSTEICRHIFVDNLAAVSAWRDDDLLSRLDRLASTERASLPEMLACLSVVEQRGLHLDRGYSSMFEYCVERLKWSEGSTMQRLIVAGTASRYPEVYSFLQDGQLNLSAVSRLSAHLTPDNRTAILARAAGRRRADLDELLRELRAVPARLAGSAPTMGFESPQEAGLPFADESHGGRSDSLGTQEFRGAAPVDGETVHSASGANSVQPERRVRLSLLAGEELRRDLDRSSRLLRRSCPSGSPEDVIAYVLHDFLRRRDPALRLTSAERPRRERQTRAVPQWVKDRVWKRDGGRCAYASRTGRRCAAREELEYDHIHPWARGGSSDDPGNIRLLCRAHNRYLARQLFGDRVPRRRA